MINKNDGEDASDSDGCQRSPASLRSIVVEYS